jgi:type I restriction enzyme S subunit
MPDDTALLLERHFDTAFAAPEGVQKLRELILTLAMQGKLVPQDPTDPPASELLKEIEAEKQRLVKEGKIKKAKPLPEIQPEEVPYELPDGWLWVRLGMCLLKITDGTHHSPPNSEVGDFLYISAKNIKDNGVLLENATFVSKRIHEEIYSRCDPEPGNILYIKDGATTGIVTINNLEEPFSMLSSVALLKQPTQVDNYYLLFALRSPFFYSEMRLGMTGVAITRVTLTKLNYAIIPFPPLPEQRRIVAKIDELMARCDELEKLRAQRDQQRITVHRAAIARLLDTTTQPATADFGEAWQFITHHFGDLYTVKANVAELRKAILQLAVMGKLVPQAPNDPPARELLKEIEVEKQRLMKEGKIRIQKPLPELTQEDTPYDVPDSWEWIRFEAIIDISSGVTKGRKLEGRKLVLLPYLRVANVQRSYLDLNVIKEIEIPTEELERYSLQTEDLLITEGGDWDKVGRTAIWNSELPICIHQNHVFKGRKYLERQNVYWLEKYLNSMPAREYFAGASKQTTNLASINKTQLRGCPVPLPPLSEQHRIVAKIDQLMALCDQLEANIETTTHQQTKLLHAVMAEV